jgi:hypothetical protein
MKKMDETALVGWREISKVFPCSERKVRSLKDELTSCGAIFYIRLGRPPRRRVAAFPSRIKKWIAIKASKGQVI